nr:hypothetical protein [Tanacetum cinerariifolium]
MRELNTEYNWERIQGNGGIDGQGGKVGGQGTEVNDGVDGVPDFSTIIAQQLQNLLPTILAQVGDQGSNLGNCRNQNDDAANDNIRGDVRNVIENNDRRCCTYKEFLACNKKEYDGKGGAIVYTCWIEKMESVQEMSGCRDNKKVKFHELASLVPHLVTSKNKKIERYAYGLAPQIRGMAAATEPTTIQKAMQIASILTDEAIRNGSIKKNPEKKGNKGEPSKDRNGRDDNKRTRTKNAFATTTNPVRRENIGHLAKDCRVVLRNVNPVNAKNPAAARGACFECDGTDHYKSACPGLNRAQGPGVNLPNQALAVDGGQGRGNNCNQVQGRAFMLGSEEARQDSNMVMGTFTLNNHYATTLFDSGVDYSFVSTTFIPLLGIELSDLRFSYEIEISSGQLVEIDKVIKGFKLEIDCHVFDISLIPFENDKVLKVLELRLKEKSRHLMSAKAKKQKQEEMVVVRDFPEIMATSAIIVSSDSSDESVGSPPSWVILFGDIPTVIPSTFVVAPETSAIAPVISFATHVVEMTLVASPTGLCGLVPYSDSDSNSPDEMDSSEYITRYKLLHHSYTPILLRLLILLMDHHRRTLMLLLLLVGGVREAIPLGRPYRTRPNGPQRVMTARKSLADSVPSSTLVTGSLAPTRVDLLPPHKRFRDSYSSETSMEEDTKIGTTETEDGRELDIVDRDDARDHVEIDPMDIRDGTEEYEADTSAGDTVKVGIDPMSALVANEESKEPAGEDSSDSYGTRDGLFRSFEDMPIDLDDVVHYFYHYMFEVRIDRIFEIETVQRRLEADQLIASVEI